MAKIPSDPSTPAEALADKLSQIGVKAKEKIVASGAAAAGFPYIDLIGFPIAPEAIALIPKEQALAVQVVCFFSTDDEIRVGAVTPTHPQVAELLFQAQERSGAQNGGTYTISERSFKSAMKMYDALPNVREVVKGVAITEADLGKFQGSTASFTEIAGKLSNLSVTEIVTLFVAAALQGNASDIHVEAEEKDVVVRFRLDGILNDVARLPHDLWPKIASRIKLLAGLKINIADRPQDGRFTIRLKNDDIDVRVSMLPTSFGESVVMRLLRASGLGKDVSFADLGLQGSALAELTRQAERPNGMVITTGPTGSGKTTTLYAMLKKLNKPDVKIITLEDPVEYKLTGINQSQIDHSKDYTFAKGLRSILRQDPDVIMVGEIRDLETAEIAIQAALTGHLVLSTIHTNSASGAIPRFLSMGVKPFLLAPALNAVIGQRLVRMLCTECKKEDKLPEDVLARVKKTLDVLPKSAEVTVPKKLTFWKGGGCDACLGLGFKGRIGIYEIMPMDKDIEQVILSAEVSEYKMEELAIKKGMITMVQDGILKALAGVTTVDEVFRVAE